MRANPGAFLRAWEGDDTRAVVMEVVNGEGVCNNSPVEPFCPENGPC
jgi:hypothetical protein